MVVAGLRHVGREDGTGRRAANYPAGVGAPSPGCVTWVDLAFLSFGPRTVRAAFKGKSLLEERH